MSELAVQGCAISIKTLGVSATNITIATLPSSDMFVGAKGIYFGTISVVLTGMTKGSLACPTGTITIDGTNSDVLDDGGNKAVQKGDKGSAAFTFANSDTSETVEVKIEITNAGQTDVLT